MDCRWTSHQMQRVPHLVEGLHAGGSARHTAKSRQKTPMSCGSSTYSASSASRLEPLLQWQ